MEMGKKCKGAGPGKYEAQCPAHEDRAASLSIGEGRDGNLLLCCHAGCTFDEVLAAANWEEREAFPPKDSPRRSAPPMKPKYKPTWPTIEGAIEAGRRSIASQVEIPVEQVTPANRWVYRRVTGEEFGVVARFNLPTPDGEKTKKQFRPLYSTNGGYALGDPPGLWPPFQLPELAGAKEIFIVEGEGKAELLATMGVAATCGAHGAKAADKTDWSLIANAGAEFIILPDNDDASEGWSRDVSRHLKSHNVSAVVRIVRLVELAGEGFPKGADIVEFSRDFRDSQDNEAIIGEIRAAAHKAAPVEISIPRPISLDSPTPASMEASMFPGWLGAMIRSTSEATETPLELAAMMGLGVVAIACQRVFTVNPEPGYFEPLCAWTLSLLEPGNRKSAVVQELSKPLVHFERNAAAELETVITKIRSDNATIEARLKELRAKAAKADAAEFEKAKGEIAELEGKLVEEPKPVRLFTDDCTPEHLGTMAVNSGDCGAILSDEAGIFAQLGGRYSNGMANLGIFLQGHAGAAVRVDRGSRPPVIIDHCRITMAIAAQPEAVRALQNRPEFRGYGLLGRFWYVIPPSPLGYRTLIAHPIPKSISDSYFDGISYLLKTQPVQEEGHKPRPNVIGFDAAAHGRWKQYAREVETQLRPGGRFEHMTDWAGKLPGAVARIAGLLHCVEWAHAQPQGVRVSEQTMLQAIAIGDVLADHALAAFDLMGADEGLAAARRLWSWVEAGRHTTFTMRDAWNPLRGTYKHVADIQPGFDVLIERGWITELEDDEQRVGRPSRRFKVTPVIVHDWGNV
jgi:hypothetical protein